VVFTPPALARRLARPFSLAAGLGGPPLLDPACGEGALLLAALELRGGTLEEARHLFGIELDPELCARARARLGAAVGLKPREFSGRIVCADALDPTRPWPPGSAILANPPWLSFSGRHAAPSPISDSHRGPGGWPSLQAAFLERIARHCAREAQPARLLLPGSMLELERYGTLRAVVAEFVHLSESPEELGEDAFSGILEPAVLVSYDPGPAQAESLRAKATRVDDLLRRLEGFPRFAPETFADAGVHSGNSARWLVVAEPDENTAPIRRGADLAAFALGAPTRHLRLDLERTQERRFRIADRAHYTSFPVLLRQTADRPIAALHGEPTYFRNSLLAARAVDGLAPEFLVALLNAPVARYWHRASFRDARQRTFPQVKVGHLRTQPTPIQRRSDAPELHDEVVARVRALEPRQVSFDGARRAIDSLILHSFGLSRVPERD
jgi:hypothetical protein